MGVLASTGEVFFKEEASSFNITIVVPRTGTYEVALDGRAGSTEFDKSATSLCTHWHVTNVGNTNSFFLCTSDPSKAGEGKTWGTRGCTSLETAASGVVPVGAFYMDVGVNTLWLASRERCSLASQLIITPPPPPSLPSPPLPPLSPPHGVALER